MALKSQNITLDQLPEVFVSNLALTALVSREVRNAHLRKLGSRVYTKNLKEAPELIVKRNVWMLVAGLFPGALIADRTALENRPAADGSIFLISTKKNPVKLPGITIRPRRGVPALESDREFIGGLRLSSPGRAYLENMRPSRARAGAISRTLNREELEESLEDILQLRGKETLNQFRDDARRIAASLALNKELKILERLIGTLLGTKKASLLSQRTNARVVGLPYDAARMETFETLRLAVEGIAPITRPESKPYASSETILPFFEAYFSNFIEGTEFEVEEASAIVFEGKIPKLRPQDAHDILGTYRIVANRKLMSRTPKDPVAFSSLLRSFHAQIMAKRPTTMPGQFKKVANRAGATFFVSPELVEGTLQRGFEIARSIRTPFGRAVFMMFLISEIHPFLDGNGRTARIFMNMELVAAQEQRIIIPTIYRNDYIGALKGMSHNKRAETLVRVLDFAQKYTGSIDWSEMQGAHTQLDVTHAFYDPADAETRGLRLRVGDARTG